MTILGIIIADDELRQRVDRFFHWPMIVLALLVLPLLLVEFLFLVDREDSSGTPLWWTCLVGTLVIWLAFVIEYIVKISIAENRIEYARRNWLDALIILLPVLRPLRVAYIARTSRVFTLRGVVMKFLRYIFTIFLGLEASDRLARRIGLRVDRTRIAPEHMTRQQLHDEVRRLRRLVEQWNCWHAAEVEHLRKRGIALDLDPHPTNTVPPPDQTPSG